MGTILNSPILPAEVTIYTSAGPQTMQPARKDSRFAMQVNRRAWTSSGVAFNVTFILTLSLAYTEVLTSDKDQQEEEHNGELLREP